MKTNDILHETYTALLANKVRTGLTMLGIVIGIGSVIAMVAIGNGAQKSIENNIQSLGANLLQVTPGAQGGQGFQASQGRGSARTLTSADADAIEKNISNVQAVSKELSSRYQITGKGTNTNTTVIGVTSEYLDVRNLELAEGVFVTDQHIRSLSKIAILGPTVRDDLFGTDTNPIGQTIRINGMQFKVVGITVAKGGSGFQNQDDMVYIPLTSAQKFLAGSEYLSTIAIQAKDQKSMAVIQEDITNLLLDRHNIRDASSADFSIFNQNDIIETASTITQTFTILLGAVAGISLVVGGIGIMNMMLTTVTERTREIGLRKAIGAKNRDIRKQFLIEAIILTVVGGCIGILFGIIVSVVISKLGLIQTQVSIGSIILAFSVSACIGIIFGYYPAKRASSLNPIEALRYE